MLLMPDAPYCRPATCYAHPMSTYDHTHYEVRWLHHYDPTYAGRRTSIKFQTPEAAHREAERIRAKNDLYMEVDGFTPYESEVKVWRVDTTVTLTEVEEEVLAWKG